VLEVIPGSVATPMQADSMLIPGLHRANKRMEVGDPDELARLIIRAIERGADRVIYPRSLRVGYALPFVVRRLATRWAGRVASDFDLDDERVLRSGDEASVLAREAWERGERDAGVRFTLGPRFSQRRRCQPRRPPSPGLAGLAPWSLGRALHRRGVAGELHRRDGEPSLEALTHCDAMPKKMEPISASTGAAGRDRQRPHARRQAHGVRRLRPRKG
jgi:hypothetical protein